jgi:hypothetical protein
MRNIFDQYVQPENRITHALMTALNEDEQLLHAFLGDIARLTPPKRKYPLRISEQSNPGRIDREEMNEAEIERRGIPDAWVTAGDEWCLIIENKVLSTASNDQLRRHLATARHLDFARPNALLITAALPSTPLPERVGVVTWSTIYRWLQGQTSRSKWARRLKSYLEVMEARLADTGQLKSGTLTVFNGFRFAEEDSFSYLEGKRVLRLAIENLRQRADLADLGIDPKQTGREASRGRVKVWDFLSLATGDKGRKPTSYPHLSLAIDRERVTAMVTLPDKAPSSHRKSLTSLGAEGFHALVDTVRDSMCTVLADCPGMQPRMRMLQRHWKPRSKPPFVDAEIDIDLRTRLAGGDTVKFQPGWTDAVFQVLRNKKSNLELQVGAAFPYQTCEAIQQPEALDLVAKAWIACKPYISRIT